LLLNQPFSLALGINSLSGTILTGLGLLSRLQYLDLSGNFLFGKIPTELDLLTGLSYLDLRKF
jgi:Leucine-rich repeat (LRR) protein